MLTKPGSSISASLVRKSFYVSHLINELKKNLSKSPPLKWVIGYLLSVGDARTVSIPPVVKWVERDGHGWHVASLEHLPQHPFPGTCPSALREYPDGRVMEQFYSYA